ncbi:hypothetical protein [Cellulosimicrobium sp. SL-1]|uniref:hypothetical protein n=1 Tax=Cellulosimicrobium sp. SL-1 TaxID=2699423 RepID=UPI0013D1D9FF|nr:hypothetical protein [Cellulosimicrobium sp. SL-1]
MQNVVDGPVGIAIHEASVGVLDKTGLSSVADVVLESMDERLRLHGPNDSVSLVVQSAESDLLRVHVFVDDEEYGERAIVLLGWLSVTH